MLQPVAALRVCHLLDLLLLKSTRWTITAVRPRKSNRHRVARLWCCRLLFTAPSNKPLSTTYELSPFSIVRKYISVLVATLTEIPSRLTIIPTRETKGAV